MRYCSVTLFFVNRYTLLWLSFHLLVDFHYILWSSISDMRMSYYWSYVCIVKFYFDFSEYVFELYYISKSKIAAIGTLNPIINFFGQCEMMVARRYLNSSTLSKLYYSAFVVIIYFVLCSLIRNRVCLAEYLGLINSTFTVIGEFPIISVSSTNSSIIWGPWFINNTFSVWILRTVLNNGINTSLWK